MAEGIEFDRPSLRLLLAALKHEATGKELRKDLRRNLRIAAEPALIAVRAAILTMPSKEKGQAPSLRASIAAATRIHVRAKGVAIISHNKGIPRQFRFAARRLNSKKPWRHPLFGSWERPVIQFSRKPGWFSATLLAEEEAFHVAADEAQRAIAIRISMKTRG